MWGTSPAVMRLATDRIAADVQTLCLPRRAGKLLAPLMREAYVLRKLFFYCVTCTLVTPSLLKKYRQQKKAYIRITRYTLAPV